MAKPDPGPDFWRLIEPRIGPIDTVEHTVRGYPSDVTAIVRGGAGSVFVKAARDPGPHVSSLQREAAINPYVRSVSPALRWQHHGDGWIALGFDVVDGRHADFTDPADLAMVADLVGTVGKIDCPDIARDWAESRWDRYTERPELFTGDALLYTDINPDNILITDTGAALVDWAWPTRGAAFIDPACLVIQLIAAGRHPADAEGWARRCRIWTAAEPAAIDMFAAATVAMYRRFEEQDPAPWRTAMTDAVTAWATHRTG